MGLAPLALVLMQALPPQPATAGIEVEVGMRRIERCPAGDQAEQERLYGQRLEHALAALRSAVAPHEIAGPAQSVRLLLLDEGATARARSTRLCARELQGRGVVATDRQVALLAAPADARGDAEVFRAAAHVATLLWVRTLISQQTQDRLGYGWIATGLAHRAELATGGIDTCVVRGVVQPGVITWGGDWHRAAAELQRRGQLPSVGDLLATEADDYDLAQHVLALLLVEWLATDRAPVTHAQGNQPKRPPLARLVDAAAAGTSCLQALRDITGLDLVELEPRVHAFARSRDASGPDRQAPWQHHRPHPHAAVYVYTGEPVRPRHRKVVDKALARRHAAHTSGWQRVDGKPRLAVGPVHRNAGFWHGDELVKNIPRTWPMVAVLEYADRGGPTAQLDCFRRVRGRRNDDGWMLDPSVGFVPHHNAQFVTDRDDRLSYLAVPDTPTGSHVGGSEFVHRGRVRWANGQQASVGVWTLLTAPKARTTKDWHAIARPLVDWRVVDRSRSLGVRSVAPVDDLARELSPWGTSRVFRFPAIPAGLFAARGRD